MKIPRKKSELFPCLYGRTRQNNPCDLIVFKCRDCHGHSQICLSCTGRAESKDNHVFFHCVHIAFLSQRLCLDRLPLNRIGDHFFIHLQNIARLILHCKRDEIVYVLFGNHIPSAGQFQKLFQNLLCPLRPALFPHDLDLAVALDQCHMERALYLLCIGVQLTEYIRFMLSWYLHCSLQDSHVLSFFPFRMIPEESLFLLLLHFACPCIF